MANFLKSWVDQKGTGWNYKLQIVPYDDQIDRWTVCTAFDADATVLSVGPIESGYNGLPYGIQNPTTCVLDVVLSNLPSALQQYIRNKKNGSGKTAMNLFLIFSDRGTNGVTYTLEFCGVQSKIGSSTFKKESGKYVTSIELVDAMHFAMVMYGMDFLANSTFPTSAGRADRLYDVNFFGLDRSDSKHESTLERTGWANGFSGQSWADYMFVTREWVSFVLQSLATRTANVTDTTVLADSGSYLQTNFIGNTVKFYRPATTYPRVKSTALDKDTLKLAAKVYDESLNVIGGMASTADKYAFARYESVWDWFVDITETMNAKASYRPVWNDPTGNPYVSWTWYIQPPTKAISGSAKTLNLDGALEQPEIVETEQGIGKTEVQIETEGSDVKAWVVNSGVSRADRQFTLRCKINNAPTTKPDYQVGGQGDATIGDADSVGFFQTNTLYYDESGTVLKVHETVGLTADGTAWTDYTTSDGVNIIGDTPPTFTGSDDGLQEFNLWVQATQRYGCLPYSLAKHITAVFGSDYIATFDVDVRITDNPSKVLNENLGELFDLSASTIATDLPQYNWSNAVLLGVKADHAKNTSTLTFMLVP